MSRYVLSIYISCLYLAIYVYVPVHMFPDFSACFYCVEEVRNLGNLLSVYYIVKERGVILVLSLPLQDRYLSSPFSLLRDSFV